MDNNEIVEKVGEIAVSGANATFTTGGTLNNKQQKRFLELIRSYGNLLPRVRFVRMTQANQDIDKLHLGEPVTRGAVEGSSGASVAGTATAYAAFPDYPYKAKPKFNKITLTAHKVRSDWALTTESLQENIAGNSLEASVMGAITERMAHDMEEMAINGDTGTTVTGLLADAPLEHLRDVLDGWDKLSDNAIILDNNGSYVSKMLFSDMIRIQPKEHKADPGMIFVCSDNVAQDWGDMLSERVGALGDSALQGGGIAPFGKPLLRNSIVRDDRPITTTGPNEEIVSSHFGPFETDATHRVLQVTLDGAGTPGTNNITFTLPIGTYDANEMVALLTPSDGLGGSSTASKAAQNGDVSVIAYNGTHNGTSWRVAEIGDGRIVIYSIGASSQVFVEAGATNDVSDILGFKEAAGSTDPDTGGSVTTQRQGSNIMLVNPRNLIWGVLDGTRIFTEYNKDSDVIESVVYNQVAAQIEETRAIVKAINVRAKTGWPV